MDWEKRSAKKNPRANANLLSKLSFFYLFPIFLLGFKRDLVETDLEEPLKQHSSDYLSERICRLWDKEVKSKSKKGGKPSLFKVLLKCFTKDYVVTGIATMIYQLGSRIAEPICMGKMLNYFSAKRDMHRDEAMYWAIGLIVSLFFGTLVSHHLLHYLMHVGIKMNVACSSLLYKKMLRLSMTGNNDQTTVGQMVNLLSNDMSRLEYLSNDIHCIWVAPLQMLIVAYIMYEEVGWSSPIGLTTLFIFLIILGIIGKKTSRLIPKCAFRTDDRLRLMTEIISGIQAIKMYAWEKPFSRFVENLRRKETDSIKYINIYNTLGLALETCVPRLCLFVTIVAYVLFGNNITVEKAYLVMSYYNILRTTLFIMFPLAIQNWIGARVTVKRFESFLAIDELKKPSKIEPNNEKAANVAVSFKNAYAKWSNDTETDVLQDISFTVKPTKLVAVVGQVGSGKSSLLHVILKELSLTKGSLEVNGKISYTSQAAWIFASTVRQNILFGNAYDEERYNKVVEVCQLERDFALLPYGDKTVVGDRGSSLSGGQCARINLARAVYMDADIYLFDDPLSAVDSNVGRRIFDECFIGFLKEKTIILVTHQIQYLNQADQILVLHEGKLLADGTVGNLKNSDINLMKHLSSDDEGKNKNETEAVIKEDVKIVTNEENEYDDNKNKETRTLGRITTAVYIGYFAAVKSWAFTIFVLLLKFISVVTIIGCDLFLAFWINEADEKGSMSAKENEWYIIYYGAITALNVVLNVIVVFFFHEMSIRAARNLHADMFNSIVQAVMKFFNNNPSGRILNRFSKDIGIIDFKLPMTVTDVAEIFIYFVLSVILVTRVNPYLLIVSVVMVIIFYLMRKFYIITSRSLKRLEGITRSPIFDHVTATVRGLPTIRAFQVEDKLNSEFDRHQDIHTSAWFNFISSSRCLGIYLDIVCNLSITATVIIFLFIDTIIAPGDVGFVISQGITLLGMIQWGVRQSTEMENFMTSVERVLEYTKLESEAAFDTPPDKKPPSTWPAEGRIEFKNVYLSYDHDEPPVLNNLNFTILPGEKVGIVGRTGAGKSSLISALFRLAYIKGDIYIDGVETSTLGIHDLRSKISIIPQEPVLFAGTLRKNLDPFDDYADSFIWQALEDVEMKRFVEGLVNGLYTKVSESGTNFSSGQRQLLCLARTVITKNRILVLDEATASVDLHTDELIQKTVRKNFQRCTVITIAHRLNTIMDCDRVLVMNAGNAVQFDHPHNLLEKQSGFFYDLVQQTGTNVSKMLTNIAKTTYEEKKQA